MIGKSIGSYQITAKLGEGGMGVVYLGEHRRIARRAAIKVLLPELSANQQIVARFFNEARATSLIAHPGIVEIIDCEVLPDGNAYIVMELLQGESLGSVLRRGERLSVQRAAFLARHIADALAAAHDQRIVHRDLKPDNVFLPAATGTESPHPIKILDFGVAKLMRTVPGQEHYKTRTGSIVGTPVYMSPEQCRGSDEIDHRTDIYALGCILFEMICGRPPFTSEGFGELIQSHLWLAAPTLRSCNPAFPRSVDALVARMLAKAPGQRPQTMRAVMAELDSVIASEPPMLTVLGGPRTLLLGPLDDPKAPATWSAASAEKHADVNIERDPAITKARRATPILATAAAIALVGGGIGIWRANAKPPPGLLDGREGSSAAAPPALRSTVHPVITAKTPAAASPPVAIAPVATPALPPSPVARPAISRVAEMVKVVIASDPTGADVCRERDRILLGRTRFEWRAVKTSLPATLLIRKRGYRGQEVTVAPVGDGKKLVTLDKLGRDDIDDVVNCRRR